jgi:hypothetical protein
MTTKLQSFSHILTKMFNYLIGYIANVKVWNGLTTMQSFVAGLLHYIADHA